MKQAAKDVTSPPIVKATYDLATMKLKRVEPLVLSRQIGCDGCGEPLHVGEEFASYTKDDPPLAWTFCGKCCDRERKMSKVRASAFRRRAMVCRAFRRSEDYGFAVARMTGVTGLVLCNAVLIAVKVKT